MNKKIAYLLFVIILSGVANNAFAWGKRGHYMVSEIAFSFLDTNVRAEVHKYLGEITIEQAGTWMDDMRSDHRYDYMKPWHYVNVEKGKEYEPNNEENAVNELNKVIKELEHKEKLSDDDIKKDVLILFHLVGDLHQPLHAGYSIDKGGNDISVDYIGKTSNLHRVWDSEIIEGENITVQDCMASIKKYNKSSLAKLKKIDVVEWMNSSRAQLSDVYDFKNNVIDKAYAEKNKPLIENDIFTAGVRLASVLETVFKK